MDQNNQETEPVTTQPMEPTEPTPFNASGSQRRWLVLGGVILVVLLGGLGIWKLTSSHTDKQITQVSNNSIPTSTNYGHIMVGSNRYVNACQAFTGTDTDNAFAGIAQVASIQQTNAENTVPSSYLSPNTVAATSSCSRGFGDDSDYAGATLTFSIDQYTTAAAAKQTYGAQTRSQSDLDKVNQQAGTDFQADPNVSALTGVANTTFDASRNTSSTLVNNKILTFSVILNDTVTQDRFKQDLLKAIPVVVTSASKSDLPQQPLLQSGLPGKKIGASTYLDPCATYTAADYKKVFGAADNPYDVELSYQTNSVDNLFDDTTNGYTNNVCGRNPLPKASIATDASVEFDYYKTSDEAKNAIQQHYTEQSGNTGLYGTVSLVSGVGDAAMSAKDGTGIQSLYVAKGSYVLQITELHAGNLDSMKKLANILMPKLP